MRKYFRRFKLWVVERYLFGEALDLFILGVLGLVVLVIISIIIGYVR